MERLVKLSDIYKILCHNLLQRKLINLREKYNNY